MVLKAGSCLPLDFSPAKRLKSLALFSNSFCFSLSSCKCSRDKSNTDQEECEYHTLNILSRVKPSCSCKEIQHFNLAELRFTCISLRYRATSFRMLCPFLSWQFISFSKATSLSITDGSEGLGETNKETVRKRTHKNDHNAQRALKNKRKCCVEMRVLI